MHVSYTHFSLCEIPSSSGSGVRQEAAAQPLIWASYWKMPACRVPFPHIDKARGHVSCDPGNRVTLISTTSPACIGRRRHNFHIFITPSTYLPLISHPDPHREFTKQARIGQARVSGVLPQKSPLMSDYLTALPSSSGPFLRSHAMRVVERTQGGGTRSCQPASSRVIRPCETRGTCDEWLVHPPTRVSGYGQQVAIQHVK